jgi:N-acetylglucosamine-6-phosphate deacetylase
MKQYFCVYIDEEDMLHIAPTDNIEAMVLKHLKGKIAEGTMEDVVVIDTDVAIRLKSD